MRKRQLTIGATIALLLTGATGYIANGMRLYTRYQQTYTTYLTSCGSLVTWSPPAEIYTAFYPNQPTFVTMRYRSPTPQELRISLGIPQFTQTQTIQVAAGPAFQARAMKPPLLDAGTLDGLVGARQRGAQIELSVAGASGMLCDTSIPVVLKSRQVMRWYDDSGGDNFRYLASWVTPQDPTIATLVGQTGARLNSDPTDYGETALVGYDEGRATADQVRAQVDAIFDTLQFTRHLHYAQDNVPFDHNSEQIIQLPRDVLADSAPAGMCLETTAILASAVERVGMRPFFVIVPGHAFLGVALGDSPTAPMAYWETSDLGGGANGNQANVDGENEHAQYESRHDILRVVDVEAARALGIGPIE